MLKGKPATKKPASKTGDKLLKAALATTAANIARIEAEERGEKPAKAPVKTSAKTKVTKPKKEKRISALDAAARVLIETKEPLSCPDIVKIMAEKNYWTSPGGKTPAATLHAALMREINEKKAQSRFKKLDRGIFAANK